MNNLSKFYILGVLSVSWVTASVNTASAQEYPAKIIRIVTVSVGSTSDFASRLVAQGITGHLGQQVIVDTRPTGIIGAEAVVRAAPDGYTLIVYSNSLWVLPLVQKTPYDASKDLTPISLLISSPRILVVHPSVPVTSVKELIALARAKPGQINYGSAGTGSATHLAGVLFCNMAGINIMNIPTKSTTTTVVAVLTGELQMTLDTGPSLMPHVKSGRLRALAVTSGKRSSLYPNMPTVSETVPGYESILVNSMFAPAKTPPAIIQRLNQVVVRTLSQPDIKQKFFDSGVETVGSSPDELDAFMKSDISRMTKVIKDTGIRAE